MPQFPIDTGEQVGKERVERSTNAPFLCVTLVGLLFAGCATTTQRAGQLGGGDVYFLGVSGHDVQPVFDNEVRLAKARFAGRFSTRSREVILDHKNHRPSLTTFRAALLALGARMADEDVLVLYLASHGQYREIDIRDREKGVAEKLRSTALRAYLRDANIDRAIIVLSACFSGSFVDDLASPDRLIITAADAEHRSFGCKADRNLTFFGKALLVDGWAEGASLAEIFAAASLFVQRWEQAAGLPHSNPQYRVGSNMARWLGDQHRLQKRAQKAAQLAGK